MQDAGTDVVDAQGGKGSAAVSLASAGAEPNQFVHELSGAKVESIDVPVVGGHAGAPILPVFPQVPACKGALDKHVQVAGTDVVNAKGGKGSVTESIACAGAFSRFTS